MKGKNGLGVLIKNTAVSGLIVLFTVFVMLPLSKNMSRIISLSRGEVQGVIPVGYESPGEVFTDLSTAPVPSSDPEPARETTASPKGEPSSLGKTPEDILVMAREYGENHRDKTPSGKVHEEFFSSKSATDIIGRVAIRNTTATKNPDFKALLEKGAPLEKADLTKPTVLVFHTHTTESYLQENDGVFYDDYETRSTDPKRNMVRIGEEICRVLESHGIATVHDKNIYDESYTGAYARSRKTVLEYLEKYPTIQVVLDVHRDAIYYSSQSRGKPTAQINGKKAAQIMIITGAQEGQVTDFPSWEENLRFALALQNKAQEKYEGLMKPVYFCQRKYNMDTAKCSLLLEIGSDSNTLEEAFYSGGLIGEALGELISDSQSD